MWRGFLIAAVITATPFAVLFSLTGGLLGPHMVMISAVAPYVLLAGIPATGRAVWKRTVSRAVSDRH